MHIHVQVYRIFALFINSISNLTTYKPSSFFRRSNSYSSINLKVFANVTPNLFIVEKCKSPMYDNRDKSKNKKSASLFEATVVTQLCQCGDQILFVLVFAVDVVVASNYVSLYQVFHMDSVFAPKEVDCVVVFGT